ncbi:hypothetical protein [Shimazuella kribbensis]|uniref:hypothetical protein n=1 Tax=Shimazuella kribbensis TaxID=139808 RepID=UPI0004233E7A|nr:hypothetical protein [Shimazuella kribbensis]
MDPKKALEGFRVDALKPKEKQRNLSLPKKSKQTHKKGNAILIILCASLIGLTTGIGSAFAFGVKEMQPSSLPLDEPTAKSHIEQNEPSEETKSDKRTAELSPLKPPIDEPTAKKLPIDEPIIEGEKPDDYSSAIQNKETTSKETNKQDKPKEEKSVNNQTNNHSSSETQGKSDGKASKDQASEKKSSTSKEPTSSSPKATKEKDIPKSSSSDGNQKSTDPVVQKSDEKQTVTSKSVPGSIANESDTSTQTNSKSIPSDHVAVTETSEPKTKSGTLPDTAGDDLNHAVASLVIVCFSIAYLLAKKESQTE